MSNPEFDRQLEDLVLSELGITVDDPTLKSGIVHAIAENLAETPGTFSHYMRYDEDWGDDGEEE